jgi:anti-anti-sigma regulatory factor
MTQQHPSEQLITVDEPLEVYSAATLASKLQAALRQPGHLRVDLHGAERLHTAVLQVLVAAQRSCAASQATLAVSGAAPELQALLELAGLGQPDVA